MDLNVLAVWIGLGVIVMWAIVQRRAAHPNRLHSFHKRNAERVLRKLQTIPRAPQRLTYLRKIPPFTFEELILTALSRRGISIQRNAAYTGDGGVDGRFWVDGEAYLIQAKRYCGYIQLQDVKAFGQLVNRRQVRGLFVHTGKTGKGCKKELNELDRISLVSGDALLTLLDLKKPFPLGFTESGLR